MEVITATKERKGDILMEGTNTISTTMGTVAGENVDMVKMEEGEEMNMEMMRGMILAMGMGRGGGADVKMEV